MPDLLTGQALNRYSYANNNPTRFTDPTGHIGCETCQQLPPQDGSTPPETTPPWQLAVTGKPENPHGPFIFVAPPQSNGPLIFVPVQGGNGPLISTAAPGQSGPFINVPGPKQPDLPIGSGDPFIQQYANQPFTANPRGGNVQGNKAKGDAARDLIATAFRNNGYTVDIEVQIHTPLGDRYMDVQVSRNGVVLGGVEVKAGDARYRKDQRAKDAWIERFHRQGTYRVQLVRVK